MSIDKEKQLTYQVCQKFYIKQMSKVEIAKELNLSRFKVARLLKKALDEGYVKIELREFSKMNIELGKKLEEKLNLKSVIVINTLSLSTEDKEREVEKNSAEFIFSVLNENDVLGMSFGTTLSKIAKYFPQTTSFSNINIVQITGGFHLLTNVHVFELLSNLGRKFNTEVKMLLSPICVKNEEIKHELLNDRDLQDTIKYFSKVNVAITSIGAWSPNLTSTLYKAANFSNSSIEKLNEKNVVCDIFNHFCNANGEIIDDAVDEALIGISIDELRRIPLKIAISYSEEKSQAVVSAAKSGLIDALIIDEASALSIIKLKR